MKDSEEYQKIKDKLSQTEKRRQYYENNKYTICHKTLNVYCTNKIKKVRGLHIEKVEAYIIQHPFENYIDYLKKRLALCKIHSSQSHYHDCYDAGMMAYLYSIHRCAEMSYSHTEAYIKKLIRIYIICALVIHDDTKNLCQANGFREIRLDSEASINKF